MTTILINTQLTIVTYLIVGFLLSKTGLIDEHAQLFISNLTINVLLPASVFTSFLSGVSMDLLSLGTILILAVGLEVFLSLASKTGGSRRFTPGQACVAHYGYLVSNGGLIGTPVIESLFGAVGVMCCNVFMIPTRILAFSAGESIFNPSLKRTPQAVLRSVATNKIIDVMALGLVMIYFNLSLPAPILTDWRLSCAVFADSGRQSACPAREADRADDQKRRANYVDSSAWDSAGCAGRLSGAAAGFSDDGRDHAVNGHAGGQLLCQLREEVPRRRNVRLGSRADFDAVVHGDAGPVDEADRAGILTGDGEMKKEEQG